jgi:flagellar assembly protein FliH
MEQNDGTSTGKSIASSFVETPYEDQSWEIVGERLHSEDFEPMEFATIRVAALANDPMFEDYGGVDKTGRDRRWHLPDELAHSPERARRIAEEVQAEVVPMVPESEVERMCAEAYERGKQEARAQAESEQAEKIGAMAKQVETVLQDLQGQLNAELMALEQSSVDLAIKVAEKLVGTAVEINPEYIVPILSEALTLAKGAAVRKVRVSPADMEFIEVVGVTKIVRGFDGTWSFESDPTIKSGCVVETSAGEIDFQLDKAWERINAAVVKAAR